MVRVLNPKTIEGIMAKKKAVAAAVLTEQTLPGMEPEALPPALEKAIAKFHAVDREAKQSAVDHKKNVDLAFATVKNLMHEHDINEVKLRIDGNWQLFKLLATEKGKFKKIKTPADQKPKATKKKV